MENKLHTFEKSLDKLNLVDVNKFSTTDFKSVNKDIETQLNNFKELLDLDNPANDFVASFIGNPAMNLLNGVLKGGVFSGENITVKGLKGADGPARLGFRAEDASLAKTGAIKAPIYTAELLGDATMLTVKAGGAMVSVKVHKDVRSAIGEIVTISVPASICHLFDVTTGNRIKG